MEKELDVLKALQGGAVTAAEIAGIPIAALGRNFTTPSDGPYLKVVHIPNNVTNEFWGKGKTYRGIFRLILHNPIDDEGAYPAMEKITEIAAHFTKGAIFQSGGVSVRITEEPDLTGIIEAPPEILYPVSVRYLSYNP